MKRHFILLLHIAYWFLYLFVIELFERMMRLEVDHLRPDFHFFSAYAKTLFSIAVVPALVNFYLFYYFLFPSYLYRKRFISLILLSIVFSIVSALMGEVMLAGVLPDKNIFIHRPGDIISATLFLSFVALVNGCLGMVLKGFITWYNEIHLKEELKARNFEMELALVKAQINPHFLFNTINNIDVLIQKDPAKASLYLNKLSDIMRFMLYEAKSGQIPLRKELEYIDKYISLQKIRTANNDYVKYQVQGDPDNHLIEPMLFIPFIENAFKYADNKKVEQAISIRVTINKDSLLFESTNQFSDNRQHQLIHNGLGNELMQQRLNLLYPHRHELEITDKNGIFRVKLLVKFGE